MYHGRYHSRLGTILVEDRIQANVVAKKKVFQRADKLDGCLSAVYDLADNGCDPGWERFDFGRKSSNHSFICELLPYDQIIQLAITFRENRVLRQVGDANN